MGQSVDRLKKQCTGMAGEDMDGCDFMILSKI